MRLCLNSKSYFHSAAYGGDAMTMPNNPQGGLPLDARRAELRAKGCTEDEISRIIVRETAQPQTQPQAGAAGFAGQGVGVQGVWTGALNNLSVALAYVKGFLPSIAEDIANLIGAGKSVEVRSRAGVFLVAKLAFAGVLAFAVYQEYQQHIIYATETARQQALKAAEDTEIAKNQAAMTGGERPAKTGIYKSPEADLPTLGMPSQSERAADSKNDGIRYLPDGGIDIMSIPR